MQRASHQTTSDGAGSSPVMYIGETLYTWRRNYQHGLVVVHQGMVFHLHQDQQIAFQYQPDIFSEYIRKIPSALIVGCHIATKVKDVADYWADSAVHFQVSATPVSNPGNAKDWALILGDELAAYRPNQDLERAIFNNGIHIKFIGWKTKAHAAYEPKHYVVDPYLFAHQLPHSFRKFDLRKMIEWSAELLEWFEDNDIMPAPAYHKVSAQLLRTFFNEGPNPNLNERLRPALPGNHYRYFANPKLCYPEVIEVDQSSAHHHSALDLAFPLKHSLRVYAHNDFPEDHALIRPGTQKWDAVTSRPGLHLMKLHARFHGYLRQFYIPPFDDGGTHVAWVYSNELDYMLNECEITPEYIIASFVSEERDVQPNFYARYALNQIAIASPVIKAWLKPTLLSTYGMLGARPFEPTQVQLQGNGDEHDFHVGRNRYMKMRYSKSPIGYARYANIMHRGLIEAETRKRTLQMARYLHELDYKVLAIYADGVYVAGNRKDLPLLDAVAGNWRIKELTHAYFPKSGQVICDQYEKLPGMIGKVRKAYVHQYRLHEEGREDG